MTRHVTREAMVPVEVLSGGPVAFQGMGSDAALFGPRSYGEANSLARGSGGVLATASP